MYYMLTNSTRILAKTHMVANVRYRLSDTFQLTIVTQQDHILLTSGFNHSIAHSFGYLETKIQVCDITRTPVRPPNVHEVNHQL